MIKRRAPRNVEPRVDIGPVNARGKPMLAQHGDVAIVVIPAVGRRAQRQYIHDRLYKAARITRAEYNAAERWSELHAIASGARLGEPRPLERIDGARSAEPADCVLDALTMLRGYYRAAGPWGGAVLVAAICEGMSLRRLAARFCGGEGGRACEAAEALLIGALSRIAETS